MKAYTYYLYHKPTGLKYYGIRFKKGCHPDDLWNKYFSSSKEVHKLIEEYGVNSFEYEIRKTFDNIEKARDWEHNVLNRLKVQQRTDWLNKSLGKANLNNKTYGMLGKRHSEETKIKMSKAQSGKNNHMFGKRHSEEAKKKISLNHKCKKPNFVHPLKDKQVSAETKKKLSLANTGRMHTKKSIEKIKIARSKQIFSDEDKRKMSNSAKGRKWYTCQTTGKRIFYRVETI